MRELPRTDPKDATVLADYARRNSDRLSWCKPSDEMLTHLRILNGRDTDLAADATRIANRLRDALLAVSPALERTVGSRLTTNRGLRETLTRWGNPTELKTAGRTRIRRVLAKYSTPRTTSKLVAAIWDALDAQTVIVAAETVWADTVRELAADLDSICERRKLLAEDIEAVFMAHPLGKVISTMCGFGPRTGARTLAEIGDPHRFDNASRLASYAGLVPIDWQSGSKTITRKPRGGNHRLKNALFTAAFVATRHDPCARAYYQQKRNQGKRHNAAVICVARKRCNIILTMLKTRTPYQQHHQQKNIKKTAPTHLK
ncbi:MAG: IS110 family transposase [Acidimicrobiaceae bacterium]|nr:IS110 family transposase [Acidimicrobiaceae bacterium]